MSARKKIAAIITEYRVSAHADVIVGKFIKGFPTDEGLIAPRVDIASMYLDQIPENDIGRALAEKYGIPVYRSIRQALCLGGDELAVDGVLAIGEHGSYAFNEKGQHLYPRRYFFEQICGVIATSGRTVPVFNDKHLSYNWDEAKWMYERAAALKIPLMAGSSVPLFWRDPWLEHELETPIEEAIMLGIKGMDGFGFHALEGLQTMVERRRGGEQGIAAVQALQGDAVWQAGDEGQWSWQLAEAALERVKKETAAAAAKHLLIHFHGAPETVKEAFSRSELDAALAVVNFPGLSSAYSQPFQMDAGLFQQILQHSRNAVTNSPVADHAKPWQRISISSFSAGYGAVREILKAPSQFDQVAAIVAADSMGEVHDKSLAK